MIADLGPYLKYKPTRSTWLGEIPGHWDLHSLRNLTQPRSERNRPELTLLSVERERGVIVRSREKATNHNFIPDDLSNYKVAKQGDLVINKMKAWQGSMGIAPCDGIVSPAYYLFRFKFADRAFAHRLLRSKPYVAHFAAASDGVRIGQWDLSIAGMRNIPIVVPPPVEQELIVRFLDWASVRLGKAIAAKRKVIGLLEEQKQAIIHRAVTRGLDDTVPLKPSGLDWLGYMPEHWELRRLKTLLKRIDQGVSPLASNFLADANSWGVLKSGCVNIFRAMNRTYYRRQVEQSLSGAEGLANNLPVTDLKTFWFAMPPLHEANQIAETLDRSLVQSETTIRNLASEIHLLLEYRTRLIADVVIGKLDVRKFARTLPADIAEEAADLANSELVDDEFTDSDDELADELAGEPA